MDRRKLRKLGKNCNLVLGPWSPGLNHGSKAIDSIPDGEIILPDKVTFYCILIYISSSEIIKFINIDISSILIEYL